MITAALLESVPSMMTWTRSVFPVLIFPRNPRSTMHEEIHFAGIQKPVDVLADERYTP